MHQVDMPVDQLSCMGHNDRTLLETQAKADQHCQAERLFS